MNVSSLVYAESDMELRAWLIRSLVLFAMPLAANDIIFLQGQVRMQDGSAPGKSVEIELSCKGSDPVRQTNAGKNGKYFLKVERDDFNHVARALPATATDVGGGGTAAGACAVLAKLAGYESSSIDLSNFTIGKDLKLPPLVLKAKGAANGGKN